MRVLLAEHAGACYGVQRALDIAYGVLESGRRASTLGPLIHNPQVVADLEARGMRAAASTDDVDGGTVIIRSHGITPDERERLSVVADAVVDATCPHVSRAQRGAAELADAGCRVIVVGEKGHPEVEALVAYAGQNGAKVDVVLSPDEIPADLYAPIGVVVQTTQTRRNLDAVLDELDRRGLDPILKDTICSATQDRQRSAAELARVVDAMVVIGGRNSSNTTRLAEICAELCPRTFHIESAQELDAVDLDGVEAIGVTAGASTPEDQISAVIASLEHR